MLQTNGSKDWETTTSFSGCLSSASLVVGRRERDWERGTWRLINYLILSLSTLLPSTPQKRFTFSLPLKQGSLHSPPRPLKNKGSNNVIDCTVLGCSGHIIITLPELSENCRNHYLAILYLFQFSFVAFIYISYIWSPVRRRFFFSTKRF